MKKIKKLIAKHGARKKLTPERSLEKAIRGIPRITNETVAEHREEVLGSARKYIYPLQHSPHRVIIVSATITAAALITFFTYSLLALYRFQSSSTFIYRVAQVIPFPVAKAGSSYVSYESYLFELRHYIHYYQTQQKVDFKSDSGQRQLKEFRQQALDGVIQDAYVKRLAKEHKISVSNREVNDQVALIQAQNRLGDNPKAFSDVLKEFWGWSLDDFKRELRQQMLAQKVVATLDTKAQQRAKTVHDQLVAGADFGDLAMKNSDDHTTGPDGGRYGFAITRTNRDVPPAVLNEMFRLKAGETSDVINAGSSLEIVKVFETNGTEVQAGHIGFAFQPLSTYVDPVQKQSPAHKYIAP